MASKLIQIDVDQIIDWETFHDVFQTVFGFPDYYGRNLNAWIDCMTYLDEPPTTQNQVSISDGEFLVIGLKNARKLRERIPEIFEALVDCIAFVNARRIEVGEDAILAISYMD